MAISMSSRRTSTCLPTLILIFPARVHSSSSPMKSSIEPAFSDDHILIDEYGSEYTSTFLPRSPCASRTIKRFVVKIAESRKVAYAATGCSPGTMRLATSCGDWNLMLEHPADKGCYFSHRRAPLIVPDFMPMGMQTLTSSSLNTIQPGTSPTQDPRKRS